MPASCTFVVEASALGGAVAAPAAVELSAELRAARGALTFQTEADPGKPYGPTRSRAFLRR
jgi:hypothetical protein